MARMAKAKKKRFAIVPLKLVKKAKTKKKNGFVKAWKNNFNTASGAKAPPAVF